MLLDSLFSLTGGILPTLYIIMCCCVIERIGVLERYSLAARVPGVMMNMAQVVLSAALSWPISQLWDALGFGVFIEIPLWQWLAPLGTAGYALQFVILVMVTDFLGYWRHRAEHRWFWAIHVVHHAPTELHAANDIGHPSQVWLNLLFVSIPLSLFQLDGPGLPQAAAFLVTLWSYYIHSPIDVHFGPLRKALVDNRYHRIHHSREPRHFDKNFAVCFSIWDRMFGTAYDPAPDEWPKVGVPGVAAPRTLGEYLMLPFSYLRSGPGGATDSAQTPIHAESET